MENKASTNLENELTLKDRLGYGAGDAGGVITLVLISGYMMRYVVNVLGVDPAVYASILLIWNIWDMVNDPLVGGFMDKMFERNDGTRDKFRPWILWSIPLIVGGFIAFFTAPNYLNGFVQVAALFLLKVVYEFGYTMMNIGMGSLLGAMATNDTERASLASARGLGSTVGSFIGGLIIPQILANLGETPTGYAVAGTICAILGGILVYIHYMWTEERNTSGQVASNNPEDKVKFTDILNVFKQNRAFLALSLHSVIIIFGQTMNSQSSPYVYADILGDIGLMSFSATLGNILSIVILLSAPKLTEIFGSIVKIIRISLISAIVLYGGLFFMMITMDVNNWVYLTVSGLALGLMMMSVQLQWGLVSESIDYNEYLTGKRSEGSIYGVFSLTRRVGQMITMSLVPLIISWIGYDTNLANSGLGQTAETNMGLTVMNLLIPAIASFGSYICFRFIWNIDEKLSADIAAWKDSRQ
ncbi:MFS transporter [Aerococcaceae bacterium DSM 111176]|nr:MFS transporter [Aerococcaceae bacterium DSM 111176]